MQQYSGTKISNCLGDFEDAGFGQKFCPWMVQARFAQGKWHPFAITETAEVAVSPAAKGLHYGIEIFEGMRAFRTEQGLALYRPHQHWKRMAYSAQVVGLAPLPEQDFLTSLKELVRRCSDLVPSYPGSLYLRPFMMGVSPQLGVGVADEILFLILASPFGMKLNPAVPKSSRARICTEFVRAFPGGTGNAKVAGNYAASLRAIQQAKSEGFDNVLFLDAVERRWIEEFSGMNFFCVDRGVLKTPPLSDTILAGITRDSLLMLARESGIPSAETRISVEELSRGIEDGTISEVMGSGTGSAVVAITEVKYQGKTLRVGEGQPGLIAQKLSRALADAQFGKVAPPQADWIVFCQA